MLGALGVVFAALSIWLWWWLKYVKKWTLLDSIVGAAIAAVSLPAIVIVVWELILDAMDLAPAWLKKPAEVALNIVPATFKAILSAMPRKKSEPPADG
jgi:hypothetical protein